MQHDEVTTRISDAVAFMGPTHALGGWAALHVHGNLWFPTQGPDGDNRLIPIHCEPGTTIATASA